MYEITLATPGKNALGTASMMWLIDQLHEAAGRPILLTGTADAFSAGLNLREVSRLEGDAVVEFLGLLERCMCALYFHPAPTVALVNGHAIAGGCILALCCDWRVATSNPRTKIGLNEVALGVRFPPRIMAIVKQRVPRAHLEQVVLGAGLFDPPTAVRYGLVDEVADDAPTVARARMDSLRAHPADAYAIAKRELRGSEETLCPGDEQARLLREAISTWSSPALKQRIASLLGA